MVISYPETVRHTLGRRQGRILKFSRTVMETELGDSGYFGGVINQTTKWLDGRMELLNNKVK